VRSSTSSRLLRTAPCTAPIPTPCTKAMHPMRPARHRSQHPAHTPCTQYALHGIDPNTLHTRHAPNTPCTASIPTPCTYAMHPGPTAPPRGTGPASPAHTQAARAAPARRCRRRRQTCNPRQSTRINGMEWHSACTRSTTIISHLLLSPAPVLSRQYMHGSMPVPSSTAEVWTIACLSLRSSRISARERGQTEHPF
jgi:hypothetical protein